MSSQGAPIALTSGSRPPVRLFEDGGRLSWGSEQAIVSAAANTDSGGPGGVTTVLRPGNVLCKRLSDKLYYTTASGTGDASAVADVAALITADATWDLATISVYEDGVLIRTVTLGAGDDTDAEVVTALNGDAVFFASFIASASGSRVHVKSRTPRTAIKVISSLTTAFGATGTETRGADGVYVVTKDYCDQRDGLGVAVNQQGVGVVDRGWFVEASLVGLTQDAKSVLLRNGSRFA